jgi:N-acetylneuraminic acid mutarotase
VWTGGEMIIWGGFNAGYLGDGGRYDPTTDSWTPVPADTAVSARIAHKAVWTGSEMLVWGGFGDSFAYATTGARYDPVNSTWAPMSTTLAPTPRTDFSAIWTGSDMIIWGGVSDGTFDYVGDGGRYNAATDTWTVLPPSPVISRRGNHAAVWTGSEMLLWGGRSTAGDNSLGDGGRYDPAAGGGAGKWSAIPPNPAIGGRSDLGGAVWTGIEMLLHSPHASERGSYAEVFSYTPPKTLYLYLKP